MRKRALEWAGPFVVTFAAAPAACTHAPSSATHDPTTTTMTPATATAAASTADTPATTTSTAATIAPSSTPTTVATAPTATTKKDLPKIPPGAKGQLERRDDGTCWFRPTPMLPPGFKCKPAAPCMPPNPPPPHEVECPTPGTYSGDDPGY